MLVRDTPIWYNPGKGPQVAFTLTYSNENSNTGIFGRGWRSPYDMKVFFGYQSLQVHRSNGRIETYEWNGSEGAYVPRYLMRNYGYRDTIKILTAQEAEALNIPDGAGTVMLSLRSGGKYFFKKAGSGANVEGRIYIIQDEAGYRVTCEYTNGRLSSVTDASGGVTNVETEGEGINERVTTVKIPKYENGQWVQNDRQAQFSYTDGNLTSITDMLGDESTLSYGALAWSGSWMGSASTHLHQDVTVDPLVPDNGGNLEVDSTDGFPDCGRIQINYSEEMTYSSKTGTEFKDIKRGTPASAYSDASVALVQSVTTLSEDMTTSYPANGGSLNVASTHGFPSSGWVSVGYYEIIGYTGKTAAAFTGITRVWPTYDATSGTSVYLLDSVALTPYLKAIETPAKKTMFTYEWWTFLGYRRAVAALHEVYECGPTEDYDSDPTIHYAWCSTGYYTNVTRYPSSVTSGASGCFGKDTHWTGGLTKTYDSLRFSGDATGSIQDELGNTITNYGYNSNRDRTSVEDGNDHATVYTYDSNHNVLTIKTPVDTNPDHNRPYRTHTYYTEDQYKGTELYNKLRTESDAAGRLVKTYTYNSAGQITQIDTPLGTQAVYHYTDGRLDYTRDGRDQQTNYYYNESGEGRGFLTSVHDPENKATEYHYDSGGRRDKVTDPSGNVIRYEYDDLDRVTKVIHGSGENDPYTETKYTCCHKAWVQDENGRRVYYVYDAKGRAYKEITSAKSTTLAASITPTSPADGGNLAVASVTDFPNSGKVVVLDEIISYTGRNTENNTFTNITRGADSTRKVSADSGYAVGRVDTVQATYGYHATYLDWKVSLTDALGHTTYYTYYDNGKLKTIKYPDNKGEQYTYDNVGNLTKKEYGSFSGDTFTPNNDLTVNYEYDAVNHLTKSYH